MIDRLNVVDQPYHSVQYSQLVATEQHVQAVGSDNEAPCDRQLLALANKMKAMIELEPNVATQRAGPKVMKNHTLP